MQRGFAPAILVIGVVVLAAVLITQTNYFKNSENLEKSSQLITQEQAAKIVADIPEVKTFLSNIKDGKIVLAGENPDKSSWLIHVLEDLPDRQTTFNWYEVNKATSKVTAQFSHLSPTQNQPTNESSEWKTYTNDLYSFKYPENWYVNQYQGSSNFAYSVQVSDIKDSYNVIKGGSEVYTRIQIDKYSDPMPSSFPYTNGSSANTTIKPFKINSLKGIRGQETSTASLVETVILENPNGGYVRLSLTPPLMNNQISKEIFDSLLSSFKFTN